MWWVLSNILCNHEPKVKVKSEKAGICDGVPSTAFKFHLVFVMLSRLLISALLSPAGKGLTNCL